MTGLPINYILEKMDRNTRHLAQVEHRIETIEKKVSSLERFRNSFSRYARKSMFITIPSGIAILNIAPEETVRLVEKIVKALLP